MLGAVKVQLLLHGRRFMSQPSQLPLACAVSSCTVGCCGGRPAVDGEFAVGRGSLWKPAQVST